MRVVPQDANDPVAGGVVRFMFAGQRASAAFAGGVNTAVIGANGTANSAALKANTVAGQYQATASAAGVSGVASFTLINGQARGESCDRQRGFANGRDHGCLRSAAGRESHRCVRQPGRKCDVTFTVPGAGASATFAGGANTAVSNGSGIATSAVLTANDIVGSYVVSASAGSATPVSFSLTNRAPVLDQFVVQKGSTGRSFVRYVTWFSTPRRIWSDRQLGRHGESRIRMTYKGLDGTQNVNYGLANRVAAVDAVLALDFGTQGIGGNRNTIDGDGIYVVELDLDNNGSFETAASSSGSSATSTETGSMDDKDTSSSRKTSALVLSIRPRTPTAMVRSII